MLASYSCERCVYLQRRRDVCLLYVSERATYHVQVERGTFHAQIVPPGACKRIRVH